MMEIRANGLKRVHKNKVVSQIKKIGFWSGWIAGNNTHPAHIKEGWGIGVKEEFSSVEQLEKFTEKFLYYLNPELGRYAAFYEEE